MRIIFQIDILKEERRQLLLKILKFEESNRTVDVCEYNNNQVETFYCSACVQTSDKQDVIDSVSKTLSRLLPDTPHSGWLDSLLLLSLLITVLLGVVVSVSEYFV